MAGHSHWAGIKHKKAAVDAKRGKIWSKLSKAIIVAAKMGGGDPELNIRLRTAIADAKAVSMPKDNIERAIKKGTGELDGGNLEEILYEGYGPESVAVICEIMTDNRNRTAPEMRKIFEIHGGNLGATGCVGWMFDRKGLFIVAKPSVEEEKLMEIALENGADDIKASENEFEIICDPEAFSGLCEAFDIANIPVESKEVTRIPQNTVDLDSEAAKKVLKFIEALDDHDDVQNVSANFNIPDEAMAELAAEME
jgi:YebC/PmpR family DNA-binding regulatory protein